MSENRDDPFEGIEGILREWLVHRSNESPTPDMATVTRAVRSLTASSEPSSGQIVYAPSLPARNSVDSGLLPTGSDQAPTHDQLAAVIVLRAIIDGSEQQYKCLCGVYPELRTIDSSVLVRQGSFQFAQMASGALSRREPFIDSGVWANRSEAWQKLLSFMGQRDTTTDSSHAMSTAIRGCYEAASAAQERFSQHGRSDGRVEALMAYAVAQEKLRTFDLETRSRLADSLPLGVAWDKAKSLLLCEEI